MIDVSSQLEDFYNQAMLIAANQDSPRANCSEAAKNYLETILSHDEGNKGVLAVVMTSVIYKKNNPQQDIRNHQASIEGGYSGRTFDSQNITPFLRAHDFPAMSESGWLTRSLEQKRPYDKDYSGAIKPKALKDAFLGIIDMIQNCPDQLDGIISYLLQGLIIQRNKKNIILSCPRNLSIAGIVALLDEHFHSKYVGYGASRLPVLAAYAIYQCLMAERQTRFEGKKLLPLENHTSADSQSGRIGDIDIVREDGSTYEAVEVKFDIKVSHSIVEIAKKKIMSSKVERYYILSTKDIDIREATMIKQEIESIKNVHGCELIVNGILPTIKYYLRLLEDPQQFVANYVKLVTADAAVKFEHKMKWNELIASL